MPTSSLRNPCTWLALTALLACGDGTTRPAPSSSAVASAASSPAAPETQPRSGLTRPSRKLVCEGLKQELRIEAYVTQGLPTADAFAKKLGSLLQAYQQASWEAPTGATLSSRVVARMTHPATDAEREAAKAAGVIEEAMGEGDTTVTVRSGFSGFVITYGKEREVVPFWPPNDTDGLELFLTTKMRELRDRAEGVHTRVGVVIGKKEVSLSEPNLASGQPSSIRGLFTEYFPSYRLEDVDLGGGEAPVDPTLTALIVTQPGERYTEAELRRLDDFVMLGGTSIVFYVSAVNVAVGDASMAATLDARGLDRLLQGYGVELRRDAVLDYGAGARYSAREASGLPLILQSPGLLVLGNAAPASGVMLDETFPPFRGVSDLAFPFASALELHEERQPRARLRVVARSSRESVAVEAGPLAMRPHPAGKPEGATAPRNVAVLIEGALQSAFSKADDPAPVRSKSPSRVLLVSSSQFLANPFARAGLASTPAPDGPAPRAEDAELRALAGPYTASHLRQMMLVFKGTLDWMTWDADMAELNATLGKQRAPVD